MKKSNCLKLSSLIFLGLFFTTGFFTKAQAKIPIDNTSCASTQECVERLEVEDVQCIDHLCYQIVPLTATSSLRKFQETVKSDQQTGQLHQETFNHNTTGHTVDSITTYLIGDIDWGQVEEGDLESLRPGGAIGVGSNLVSTVLTTPPASVTEYLADLGKSLGMVKPVYAQQGIGFYGLSNLLELWKGFRNIAYFFFVIIFLLIGLAIMFRLKIDPKTVITIQNAIPKIIISLILVTFSYAIVGLLIDLIYVILSLSVLLLSGMPGGPPKGNLTSVNFGDIWTWANQLILNQSPVALFFNIETNWLGSLIIKAIPGIGPIDSLLTGIFAIIILFLIIKLFFSLITCYVMIVINTIFAPIILMLGALPGSKSVFGNWIKNLLSNILVFPAIAIFFLILKILVEAKGTTWLPPVLGSYNNVITTIIGLGGLLIINKIPDIIKGYFANKPFTAYGTAIGEAINAPGAAIGGAIGLASRGASAYDKVATAIHNDRARRGGGTTTSIPGQTTNQTTPETAAGPGVDIGQA